MDNNLNIEQENKVYNFTKIKKLKCGANPQQGACLYHYDRELDFEILQGNSLTYNNIIDSTVALETVAEFFDVAALCVSNSSNISAVALGVDVENAWDKIIDSDAQCYNRCTIASSREINLELAKKLSPLPIKVILAPLFSAEALKELSKNKGVKLVKINTKLEEILKYTPEEIKLTPFGALIQEKDTKDLDVETFKVATKKKPEQKEVEDMIFAFKVAKHVKSMGIVVAKDLRTLGVVNGETNRARAVEFAIAKVCDSPKDAVVASDGFFTTIDNIQIMAQNRISGVIQPMGSIADKEIIDVCDKLNIAMISTGIRHIKY